MNRRGFLASLFGAAAVAAVDPERLLWVPGRKLISIPRTGLLTPEQITNEMMHVLSRNIMISQEWMRTHEGIFMNGQLTAHQRIPFVPVNINVRRPWLRKSESDSQPCGW